MKCAIPFLYALLLSTAAVAQTFSSEMWYQGEVMMLEGDTLNGHFKYNFETNTVQYRGGKGTIIYLTARKVLFLEFYDRNQKRYRQLYALPYTSTSDYKTPIFFELLMKGEQITLLRRESTEYKTYNYPYALSGNYIRLETIYTYYFLPPDGNIEKFSGKRKDLLWVMKKKSGEMKKYIKTNKLNLFRQQDIIKAVAYYNSLFNKK